MAVDAHAVQVYVLMPHSELLDGVFLVFQSVVTEVAIAVVVIPLGAVGMTAAVAHGDDDHAELGEAVGPGHAAGPGDVVGLHLRTRIHVVRKGVNLR